MMNTTIASQPQMNNFLEEGSHSRFQSQNSIDRSQPILRNDNSLKIELHEVRDECQGCAEVEARNSKLQKGARERQS